MTINGTSGNDNLTGTSGNDVFNLTQGGDDIVHGLAGNDVFKFGAAFNANDQVNGGTGSDTLSIDGLYMGGDLLVLAATTMVDISRLVLGNSNPSNCYDITTNDANVAAGATLKVVGASLTPSQSLTFNGSAETDGHFSISGGADFNVLTGGAQSDSFNLAQGGVDTVDGGGGNDFVSFGAALTAADQIDGGAGTDTVEIDGYYMGGSTLVFSSTTMVNVERLVLGNSDPSFCYDITTDDATVGAGQTLDVIGRDLSASQSLTFNGSAETNGRFIISGGADSDTLIGGALSDTFNLTQGGNDTVTGGGGGDRMELATGSHADTFIYDAVSDSTGVAHDVFQHLDFSTDILEVSPAGQAPDAISAAVTAGALSTTHFDANLAAAIGAGQLAAHHAVLFTPNAGTLSGHVFLVVDMNGVAGYQANADLVFEVTGFSGTLTTATFS
jgi:Ca2+-binding RTX toxin-like protein